MNIPQISPRALQARMATESDLVVLDVRPAAERDEVCSLTGGIDLYAKNVATDRELTTETRLSERSPCATVIPCCCASDRGGMASQGGWPPVGSRNLTLRAVTWLPCLNVHPRRTRFHPADDLCSVPITRVTIIRTSALG